MCAKTGLGLEVHTCMAGILGEILRSWCNNWLNGQEQRKMIDETCNRWVQTIICAIGTPSNPDAANSKVLLRQTRDALAAPMRGRLIIDAVLLCLKVNLDNGGLASIPDESA